MSFIFPNKIKKYKNLVNIGVMAGKCTLSDIKKAKKEGKICNTSTGNIITLAAARAAKKKFADKGITLVLDEAEGILGIKEDIKLKKPKKTKKASPAKKKAIKKKASPKEKKPKKAKKASPAKKKVAKKTGDLSSKKLVELKELCKKYGLGKCTNSNKADLVERIKAYEKGKKKASPKIKKAKASPKKKAAPKKRLRENHRQRKFQRKTQQITWYSLLLITII